MKKIYLLAGLFFWFTFMSAQDTLFSFNNLSLPDTGFNNGQDLPGYFCDSASGVRIKLYNNFDSTYGSWSGFAYSTWTDDTTNSYINQWSTFAGYLLDSTFVLGYVAVDWQNNYQTIPSSLTFSSPVNLKSIYVSNTTYTALTIKYGNQFCNPFSDSDYFYLKINGFLNNQNTGQVVYYLADYRFGKKFILKDWAYVDLTPLGTVDSLTFDLVTSDIGTYGPNTPLYFAFDQMIFSKTQTTNTLVKTTSISGLQFYPNPAHDNVFLERLYKDVLVFNLNGQTILKLKNTDKINVSGLQPGFYIIRTYDGKAWQQGKLIVK